MARKGLIFRHLHEDGSSVYQAVPLVIGIYEFQVGNLTTDLVNAFHAYWRAEKKRRTPRSLPQMRTIPIGESIETSLEILPYEAVDKLIEENHRFAVAPCICRRKAGISGNGCSAPEESCLIFGDWADYYVSTGRARQVDRKEMRELLKRAEEANLVLQPSNSRKVEFICCCCGCCCGVLAGIKMHPRPAEIVESSFRAVLDAELCVGCLTCLDRCQMDAFSQSGSVVELDPDRCIGCGLCVTTCPPGALSLVRRTDRRSHIPKFFHQTWKLMERLQEKFRSP
jgi:Pyruvate/2-oxoacid:ferredoxin oxidoreductase delta subunit